MFAHITEPPPKVSEARPELPEALDAVIARAMAKAPDERYATCREMIEAARAALGGAAGRPRGRGPRSPTRSAPPRRAVTSNLPVLATPLVGRDDELAAVSALLEQPAVRLVTLTGLGGTGKTRLALEAATTLRDEFDGDVLRRPRAGPGRRARRLRDRRRARRARGAGPAARGRRSPSASATGRR